MGDIQEQNDLPEKLRGELHRLYQPPMPLDPSRRDEILRAARAEIQPPPTRRRSAMMALAAAVALAIGVGLWSLVSHNGDLTDRTNTPYARTGDIRDAYFLARELKAGHHPTGLWDVNGDGIIDDKDVGVLAIAAVRIDRRGMQ